MSKNNNIFKILGLLTLSLVLVLVLCIFSNNTLVKSKSNNHKDAKEIDVSLTKISNSYTDMNEVYGSKFQDKVKSQIENLKNSKYTIDNPLVIANPYGNNTTSLYLYFNTSEKSQIEYTVSVDGYNDFTRVLKNDGEDNLTNVHEYSIIGIIPDENNRIVLSELDSDGNVINKVSFNYEAPSLYNKSALKEVKNIKKGSSSEKLANGLYTILGNDTTEENEDSDYMAMYDNDGVIRCEIPIISYRSHRILFDDDSMYFNIKSTKMVKMDRTGYISKIYNLGNYKLHHDYVFGSNSDILVLATEKNSNTKEDKVISIDKDSGKVTEVIDLKKLFKKYYKMTKKAEGSDVNDWMHINSIALAGDGSVILSSRETSTIIKINNIYSNPETEYLIGSDNFWVGTGYESLLLKQKGEFSLQAGQHCVTYEADDSLEEGQYYLYMYNNNNTVSQTRADYDWSSDDNYYNNGVGLKNQGNDSYYYKYLVDENKGTFKLVDKIAVDYSGYVSSVQEIDGNVVIDSGSDFTTYEYDSKGKLIRQFSLSGETWVYRTFKYDFEDFWFI